MGVNLVSLLHFSFGPDNAGKRNFFIDAFVPGFGFVFCFGLLFTCRTGPNGPASSGWWQEFFTPPTKRKASLSAQTLDYKRNLTPAFVEPADRGRLFLLFSSFSSLSLLFSAFSASNSFPIFYFSNFFSIPSYFFSSIAIRNPNPHDSRILNSGCNFLTTGLLPSPVIL